MNSQEPLSREKSEPVAWGPWPAHREPLPRADVVRLLRCEGSLTAALRAHSDDTFSLRVVREDVLPLTDFQSGPLSSARGVVREVVLSGHQMPWVFAQTLIPVATIAAHPWVSQMGGQPLGDALFHRDDVTRSALSFCTVEPGDALFARAHELGLNLVGHPLWSRRSCFYLGSERLLITEVFLPGLSGTD